MTIEHYPLHWPDNQAKTPIHQRVWGSFDTTQHAAQTGLMKEISMLGGRDVILSTNIRLRKDGMPYTSDKEPEDGGVAVYFTYKKSQMCFACDKYTKVKANMQAVRKTIEALRGIERWGASEMMAKAFTGFVQLPAPGRVKTWREVLGCNPGESSLEEVKRRYRILANLAHPDKEGGSEAEMAILNEAMAQAKEALQ